MEGGVIAGEKQEDKSLTYWSTTSETLESSGAISTSINGGYIGKNIIRMMVLSLV
jgi:hypothetical protein